MTARGIQAQLDVIERTRKVHILLAVESGSRAWGFHSDDSDYDVRFIYVHERNEYLRLTRPRDVIELTETFAEERRGEPERLLDLDMVGWDLYKAAGLLRKSNPSLLEWLDSPVVYRESPGAPTRMRDLARAHFSAVAAGHHYISMATSNWRGYIAGQKRVRLKKYLYAVRPALCALHVMDRPHDWPPTVFERLLEATTAPAAVVEATRQLVERKLARGGSELDEGDRIPVLDEFVEGMLARREDLNALPSRKFPALDIDAMLLAEVA